MLTTRVFPASFKRIVSLQITSLARALPPGEFTLRTTALTSEARRAVRSASAVVTDPIVVASPSPDSIAPTAYTTAISPPKGRDSSSLESPSSTSSERVSIRSAIDSSDISKPNMVSGKVYSPKEIVSNSRLSKRLSKRSSNSSWYSIPSMRP